MTTRPHPDAFAQPLRGGAAGREGELAVRVAVRIQEDILAARHAARDAARLVGLGTVDETRLATAVSELARNALRYAGAGECRILARTNALAVTVAVEVEDHGPGIDDVAAALTPGFSTGGGLGLGLPAVQRLMDEISFDTRPGGTLVRASMVRRP
ncbi:putative anti-sigma regulatory factor, serine/threonine protein kinase [Methylobacterium sp. 4-46]|uniref:ATP-binding protein n=1 Tax=unclassified Methylobacterium TaxID=2615210 RepID=UPI000152D0FC|nr:MULTISPECIES: ATP-binding protein [Methylobacterium]ACA20821.1 putative anti-sigma regulatory factor, serine/threonine protein kinase [Methylobacterium sp. 4-46]WFT79976.1 ATP-binding protein [Methylobacterium nodulans]